MILVKFIMFKSLFLFTLWIILFWFCNIHWCVNHSIKCFSSFEQDHRVGQFTPKTHHNTHITPHHITPHHTTPHNTHHTTPHNTHHTSHNTPHNTTHNTTQRNTHHTNTEAVHEPKIYPNENITKTHLHQHLPVELLESNVLSRTVQTHGFILATAILSAKFMNLKENSLEPHQQKPSSIQILLHHRYFFLRFS